VSDTPLVLSAGDRFRLGRSSRGGVFDLGRGLHDHGRVRIARRGDVDLTLDGRDYTVRPAARGWHLALLADDATTLATYEPRRRHQGTITTATGTFTLALPRRRRKTGALTTGDGRSVAEIRVQGGVVLFELQTAIEPLVASFAATVVLLRSGFKEPEPAPRPVWEPAPAPGWATILAAGSLGMHHDFSGGGDFGGGDAGGGGGDGGQ
jgi:hypothetical protein